MEQHEKESVSLADRILTESPKNKLFVKGIVLAAIGAIFLLVFWFVLSPTLLQEKEQEIPPGQEKLIGPNLQARQEALQDGKGKLDQEREVATVGEEKLYGRDLNYELLVFFPYVFDSSDPVPQDVQEKALQRIIEKSMVLQEGAKRGYVTLTERVINTLEKDYPSRNKLYSEALSKLRVAEESVVFFDAVRADFDFEVYDSETDEYKILSREQVAKNRIMLEKKMQDVRTLVARKTKTLNDAYKTLAEDEDVKALRPEQLVVDKQGFPAVTLDTPLFGPGNEQLKQVVWALSVGGVSEVLVGKEKNPGGELKETYFIFFVMKEKQAGASGTFTSWLEKAKKTYRVKTSL